VKRDTLWLFSLIFVLGAMLRFLALGLVRHSYDQGYPAYDALRLLDGQELLLLGQPSSVFLDNPPLMAYLQAIPLILWRSPWAVYLFITALNTVALWFVYQAARKLLGDAPGLMAAFLFAINPWIIHFSQLTWVQGLLPFFTAVIAWGLWPALVTDERSSRALLAAGLVLTAMTLTYIQAFAILAPVGLLLLLFRRRIPRRPFYAGLLLFGAAFMLYGLGLASRWETNLTKLQGFSAQSEFRLTPRGLEHAVRLVTGLDYGETFIQTEAGEDIAQLNFSRLAYTALGLALIAGVIRAILSLRQGGQDGRTATVLILWFAVPILFMTVSPYPVHPHYLLLSCPAGHVLAAWGMAPLLRRPLWRWSLLLVLLLIAGLFGFQVYQVKMAAARNPTGSDFNGWTLASGARVGHAIRALSGGMHGYPRRIYADGNDVLLSSLSGTYVTTMSELDYPHYVVLPGAEPLLYVVVNETLEPEALGPLQEAFPEYSFLLANGVRISFLRALPYSRDAALALPDRILDWPSDAGLSLLGYSITVSTADQAGQIPAMECVTYWRVEALHPAREAWYVGAFYHLLNHEGQIVTNVSQHGQWGYRWQMGDIYVERVNIPIPDYLDPGEYELAIGLFDSIHMTNYPLQSPDGPTNAVTAPVHVD
jgi:4-amino-4-deoxy-L-arabinose transferase-like glycosyltransferase